MYSRRANFKFSASTVASDRLSLLSQFSKVCEIAQIDVATHYPIALTTSKNGECIYDAWHPGAWEAAMKFLKMAERDGVIEIISPKTISDETEELVQRFDSAVLPQWENHPAPTYKSIVHIESSLGFQLPHELITFARLSSSYGSFFLSVGEDYTSDSHIIEKNRSIRADASWLKKATPAPDYLIFITNNFMSDHFWCLDTREKNMTYPVVLWSPDLKHEQENMQYKDFHEFIVEKISFMKNPKATLTDKTNSIMITNYMAGHPGKDHGYDRLIEAVYYTPHLVRQMINSEPELLNCKNYAGETVMHWFVVENDIEIVELLASCGGMVSGYALTEACSLGYVDMVYLLLGIGVIPDMRSCKAQINLGTNMPRKTLIKLRRAFNRYGYQLDWPLSGKPAF